MIFELALKLIQLALKLIHLPLKLIHLALKLIHLALKLNQFPKIALDQAKRLKNTYRHTQLISSIQYG